MRNRLLDSVELGEWKSAGGGKPERTQYTRYAKATFRKDRRLNIRLSSKNLEAIQKRALTEGLPYQAPSQRGLTRAARCVQAPQTQTTTPCFWWPSRGR